MRPPCRILLLPSKKTTYCRDRGCALRPRPQGFCTWAAPARSFSTGSMLGGTGGTMVLRLDDTDVERNTEASVNSISRVCKWLGLGWDEEYRQSERLALHQKTAWAIFEKGLAYRDFTPASHGRRREVGATGHVAVQPGVRELSPRGKRSTRRRGRAFRLAFPGAARVGARRCVSRCGIRRAAQGRRGHRGLCAAAIDGCRPTTWPPAPMTPICGSRTSFAARTILRIRSSTC